METKKVFIKFLEKENTMILAFSLIITFMAYLLLSPLDIFIAMASFAKGLSINMSIAAPAIVYFLLSALILKISFAIARKQPPK